jgi:CheY-like chemotaxis protein
MKRITVLLAEDHMIVREGFRKMLELEDDFEVVGEAQDGRQAVALAKKFRPEVVLMDIAMPLLNGLEATRQVLKAIPTTKVIMLSAHSDDAYVWISAQTNFRPRRVPGDSGSPQRKNISQPVHFQTSQSFQSATAWSRKKR